DRALRRAPRLRCAAEIALGAVLAEIGGHRRPPAPTAAVLASGAARRKRLGPCKSFAIRANTPAERPLRARRSGASCSTGVTLGARRRQGPCARPRLCSALVECTALRVDRLGAAVVDESQFRRSGTAPRTQLRLLQRVTQIGEPSVAHPLQPCLALHDQIVR